MTKEELLKEAKRKYPPGTYFTCIFGKKLNFTVANNSYPFDYEWDDNQNRILINVIEKTDSTVGVSIYSKQKGWAKIISTPIINIKSLFKL